MATCTERGVLGRRHVSFVVHLLTPKEPHESFLYSSLRKMEAGGSVLRIDRKSSIESEPRTLRMDQIHFAREAALYVMKTRTVEEAMSIFTEGLETVVSVVGLKKGTLGMDLSEEFEFAEHFQVHLELPRDVVTAPF
ncbi:hypothetical protein PanWU01x14_331070 [Parasponia andersonii]|uniref:Uncharacterized protein n=1 Tax=Parasponia andersonii TaxID=3476 RepID=A0A2P5AHR4_PARAD|nr:hypothetical protein PanWU01x14_331070 [Parasponia andersonii]